uniref:Uncharacterized protein n=1 Tax=Oryza glumipatula TaxID=40148 RepID=A0A0D9ZGU1_9ORYZ
MKELMVVVSRAVVVGVSGASCVSGGGSRHAKSGRAPACFYANGLTAAWVGLNIGDSGKDDPAAAEIGMATASGLHGLRAAKERREMDQRLSKGIAPKLTRERVIDDDGRRLYLKKKGSISLITIPQFNSFDGLAAGFLAKTGAQWFGQRPTGWTGTASRRTAALWMPGATTSSTQGV